MPRRFGGGAQTSQKQGTEMADNEERGIQVTSFIMLTVTTAAFGLVGIGLVALALFILSHSGSAEWERMVILTPFSIGLGGSAVAIAARMWTIPK
jgi:hypothetical protein